MSDIVDIAALRALLEKATTADSSYEDNDRFIAAAFDNLPSLLDEVERLREARSQLQKRPIAWMRYVCGAAQFRHANDDGDPPEDQGWIALYRRGSAP